MRPVIAFATAAALILAPLSAGFAQGRGGNDCTPDQSHCIRKDSKGGPQKSAGKQASKPETKKQSAHARPGKGDSARGGQPFQRASNSRFQPPPRGQEYRVVNDHLVLADSQTMRIVTVIGLMSSLLN